ncbi:Uma2 family endonuclease [Spirosoma areae]
MKLPAPDLVIEVLSKSTARRDRGVKFTDYAANGIAEYWIVNPR